MDAPSESTPPVTPADASAPTPPPPAPIPVTPPPPPAEIPVAPTAIPAAALPVPAEWPHSGMGITSVVLGGVVMIGMFITFAIAGVLHAQGRGPRDVGTMMVGLLIMALLFVDVVALGLAIGALCQKHRKKLFGILGTIITGLILLGTLGLVALGLIMKHRAQ